MPLRRINNPYAASPAHERVQSNIDAKVFDYFFRKLLAGDRGVRQSIINQFFHAFHAECLNQKIPAEWNPENESRLADILDRINFRPPEPAAKPAAPAGTGKPKRSGRSASAGRSDLPDPVAPAQPPVEGHDDGTADGAGPQVSHTGDFGSHSVG